MAITNCKRALVGISTRENVTQGLRGRDASSVSHCSRLIGSTGSSVGRCFGFSSSSRSGRSGIIRGCSCIIPVGRRIGSKNGRIGSKNGRIGSYSGCFVRCHNGFVRCHNGFIRCHNGFILKRSVAANGLLATAPCCKHADNGDHHQTKLARTCVHNRPLNPISALPAGTVDQTTHQRVDAS